ncbi:hypothetical protein [Idiomarina aminovorans]|uniref:hypothetical protein n=1 Tax=Idiomarina aminovorans TaxID=2914829 RepID=UPI0020064730|nr:hypothetical protein [Idiomarina sp. ATCH4]MCK7460017.1 hypothetical protein [Idiomarina sp. ATCH4]
MIQKKVSDSSQNQMDSCNPTKKLSNPGWDWLEYRLHLLSRQFSDKLDGLEGIIEYSFANSSSLYAEYRLTGYYHDHVETFQRDVAYYLHQLIDSYRAIESPPEILYIKHRRISIHSPEVKSSPDTLLNSRATR